jgi:hypothetical protein
MEQNREKITKFLNPILYILNSVGGPLNKYNILKILYFADQYGLVEYNQKVTEDWYEKNPYGPVAYHAYDIMKAVEGRNELLDKKFLSEYLQKTGEHNFVALQKVDLDEFTKIQIECLDKSIAENKNLSFNELLKKSHDQAYEETGNMWDEIDIYSIAKAGGANDEQIAYLREKEEFNNDEWF